MEKIDQILDSLYDRVIDPMEAKEQLLDLFAVSNSTCDEIFEQASKIDIDNDIDYGQYPI